MKITIENIPAGTEPEIIIKCNELDEALLKLIYSVNAACKKLIGMYNSEIYFIELKDVFYFDTVDNKVFIYTKERVYESKLKLYEIALEYENSDFFRASKSIILNLSKIQQLKPAFGSRFEALLENGEKVIISRQYASVLKKKLGV